jgi:hypothetical protein
VVVRFTSEPLTYTCANGFTLDASAAGAKEFSIACKSDKSFEEAPSCLPVTCGVSPQKANVAHGVGADHVFGQKAPYTCADGFTVDATAAGAKDFKVECQADGFYASHAGCAPVVCSVAIPANSILPATGPRQFVFGDNASFTCKPGYSTNGKMVGPVSFSMPCLASGELAVHAGCTNKDDCEGNQCGTNGKCVDAALPTGVHKNDYKCVCDSGFKEDIKPDGTRTCENIPDCPIAACAPGTCNDLVNDFKCACPEGYHVGELSHDCLPNVCGVPPALPHSTTGAKQSIHFDSEPVEYNCMEGFTLDSSPTGENSFIVACQSGGSFETAPQCAPVSCGVAPQKPNAKSSSTGVHIFEDYTGYTCTDGFSTTGKAAGPKTFQLKCRADGAYTPHAGCAPVECGSVPVPEHALQTGEPSELVFGSKAFFVCKKGYSTNGKMDGIVAFSTQCQADGVLTALAQCKNMDDCQGNQCGNHGKCLDLQVPSGDHKEDYKCVCDPGFKEEILEDGSRTCKNIPDCPSEACAMGSCEDLVNDYKCHCQVGYHEDKNPTKMLDHDCLPNVCGMPPALEHATLAASGVVDFAMPPIEYKCGKGYTLDASAAGDSTFEVTCQANKSFAGTEKCLPVLCGAAPEVGHAQFEASKLFEFPEKTAYACKNGYTIDGKVGSASSFDAECTSAGTFDKVLSCLPVACPAVPAQANATFDDSVKLVYPMTTEVVCADGFKLDGSKTYEISCGSDGQLAFPELTCAPIDCAEKPEMRQKIEAARLKAAPRATVEGSTIFGEKMVATARPGYTLDGSPDGASTFEIRCQKTGSFSRIKAFQRVSCGPPPDLINAMGGVVEPLSPAADASSLFQTRAIQSRPQGRLLTALAARQHLEVRRQASVDAAFFGDTVKYQCNQGYRADSNRDGIATVDEATELTFTCTLSGDVKPVGPSACLPVTCPVFRSDSSLPTLPIVDPAAATGPQFDYVYLENSLLEELKGRDEDTTSIKSLQQFGQSSYASAEGECTLNGNCNAFCWNPDDMTTYYPGFQQGFRQVDVHQKGRGFKCFKKVARVPPSQGYQFMYNDKAAALSDGPWNADVALKDMQKPGLVKDKAIAMCSGESECDAFCWNPDQSTFFYKKHDQGFAVVPPSAEGNGAGWMCYRKSHVTVTEVNEWQAFTCAAGFSVDGTPAGAQAFSEVCKSDGQLSSDHTCKPIDWCVISECGNDGKCVNGDLGYTCDCDAGFRASMGLQGVETCEQIDECDTLGGTLACTANGKCIDGTSTYKCECDAGYEVTTGGQDRDECTPVVCGSAPVIAHATTPKKGEKIAFPGSAEYTCAVGYKMECDERLTGTNGAGYTGCQDKTRSGRTCQKWTSQGPHSHTRTPSNYPDGGLGDHNYCRNPSASDHGLWCYTTDDAKRWENCDPVQASWAKSYGTSECCRGSDCDGPHSVFQGYKTMSECQAICQSQPNCDAIEYGIAGQRCDLQANVSAILQRPVGLRKRTLHTISI